MTLNEKQSDSPDPGLYSTTPSLNEPRDVNRRGMDGRQAHADVRVPAALLRRLPLGVDQRPNLDRLKLPLRALRQAR